MKEFLILIFSLLFYFKSESQARLRPQIFGKITDAKTSAPLAGASITSLFLKMFLSVTT
jgi:hypothetical protein